MADKIIDDIISSIEALEKKFSEVNYPYQKPPYPCVMEFLWGPKMTRRAY